jgi:hypothetical protein
MRKNIQQELVESTKRYQVVVTMPKFKESNGVTCNWEFEDYDKAWDQFQNEVSDGARHLTLVPTKRIIGLYYWTECRQQVVLQGYEQLRKKK